MDRFSMLEMFVAVADQGSFTAAARTLGVSPPAVTRGIAALETRFEVALFHRSTRAVSLTDQGVGLLEKARRILTDLDEAERHLRGTQSEPRGQLYITAPVIFGRIHVLPMITDLLASHPDLSVKMLLVDRNVRIIEEGIDVAVRIGPLADSSLKAFSIGTVREVLVASPAYLERYGVPRQPVDLLQHQLIGTTGPRAPNEWRFGSAHEAPLRVKPRLLTNTVDSAMVATEAGGGIANFLSYQVNDALRAGHLIEVLRPDHPTLLPVNLLYEASRRNLPAVQAFIAGMIKNNISSLQEF
jgi:DNA-binding transcriptional LysR family regulator